MTQNQVAMQNATANLRQAEASRRQAATAERNQEYAEKTWLRNTLIGAGVDLVKGVGGMVFK